MALIKNKKQRNNARIVVVVIIFIILLNQQAPEQATYEQCNAIHGNDLFMTPSDFTACQSFSGCYPVMSQGVNLLGGVADLLECVGAGNLNGIMLDCTSNGELNNYVIADSVGQGCQSGNSVKVGTWCVHDVYKCLEEDPNSQIVCEEGDWKKPIADMVDSIWATNRLDCNVKAIGLIFVAGLVFMAVI